MKQRAYVVLTVCPPLDSDSGAAEDVLRIEEGGKVRFYSMPAAALAGNGAAEVTWAGWQFFCRSIASVVCG